jgi:hypothetical protein
MRALQQKISNSRRQLAARHQRVNIKGRSNPPSAFAPSGGDYKTKARWLGRGERRGQVERRARCDCIGSADSAIAFPRVDD